MHLKKAVVPVAGLGTRLRPTTISIPKEMLPLGRLPVIHRVVDELTEAGIDRFLMITSQGKEAIENHLRSSFPTASNSPAFAFSTQEIPAGGTKPLRYRRRNRAGRVLRWWRAVSRCLWRQPDPFRWDAQPG